MRMEENDNGGFYSFIRYGYLIKMNKVNGKMKKMANKRI
jgi:hypothetical protein